MLLVAGPGSLTHQVVPGHTSLTRNDVAMAKSTKTEFETIRYGAQLGTYDLVAFGLEGGWSGSVQCGECDLEDEALKLLDEDGDCEFVAVYELKRILRRSRKLEDVV